MILQINKDISIEEQFNLILNKNNGLYENQ